VSAPRLTIEDLSYGYPGHVVGHGISFTVGAGEVLCVLGRNGEGKSTLFKTILGLLRPRAGTLRVDGEPIAGWNPRRRALTFGYVPQNGGGTFPFTVAELVLMGRTAHRGPFAAPSAADREAADEAIATLGIGHLAAREWVRVSGGERQLALVARACADRVAVLAGGELLRIGAPAEVVTAETLAACYSVDVAVLPVADDRYRVCVPRSYLL